MRLETQTMSPFRRRGGGNVDAGEGSEVRSLFDRLQLPDHLDRVAEVRRMPNII